MSFSVVNEVSGWGMKVCMGKGCRVGATVSLRVRGSFSTFDVCPEHHAILEKAGEVLEVLPSFGDSIRARQALRAAESRKGVPQAQKAPTKVPPQAALTAPQAASATPLTPPQLSNKGTLSVAPALRTPRKGKRKPTPSRAKKKEAVAQVDGVGPVMVAAEGVVEASIEASLSSSQPEVSADTTVSVDTVVDEAAEAFLVEAMNVVAVEAEGAGVATVEVPAWVNKNHRLSFQQSLFLREKGMSGRSVSRSLGLSIGQVGKWWRKLDQQASGPMKPGEQAQAVTPPVAAQTPLLQTGETPPPGPICHVWDLPGNVRACLVLYAPLSREGLVALLRNVLGLEPGSGLVEDPSKGLQDPGAG